MVKYFKLFIIIIVTPIWGFSQNYSVSTIPDSLKENANFVMRINETKIIVKSINKAVINTKQVYTILNEKGDYIAHYTESYSKFRSINDISGALYDADGKKIKSIKKHDIADISLSDGFSLATDARLKKFSFYQKSYPYTVEFEDEVEMNGVYQFPKWVPFFASNYSIQSSQYIVEFPNDYKIRYKQFNYPSEPIINTTNNKTSYQWILQNYKPFVSEPWQPEWHEVTPYVIIAPVEFEYGGYKGNMSTWKDFGMFQVELNKGRDILPNDVVLKVHELTDHLKTNEEKVYTLYNYLQQNTRYISVQLGIGGMQPYDAQYVYKNKYGDCKALSNYMVSLLKEAGIKANYVWVAAGEDESRNVIEDFPADYFNHIITCVPQSKDSIWLECTSQTESPGYLGKFTGNRKAVLIDESGGYLVNTPSYTSKENLQIRIAKAVIDEAGNLLVNSRTLFTGINQEEHHNLIHVYNKEQKEKYLNNYIDIPTYKIEKSNLLQTKGKLPKIVEELTISAPFYASVTGKRLFIQPNLMNKNKGALPEDKERKFDIDYPYAFKEIDTILIEVPKGYILEAMPKSININNQFGKYQIQFKVEENMITMYRYYERDKKRYLPFEYKNLVKFYKDIYKADRAKVVLVKN